MNKIPIIISREYFSRVKKRSFLIASILGPIFLAAIIVLPTYLALQGGDEKNILVLDESGMFEDVFENDPADEIQYEMLSTGLEEAKERLLAEEKDGLVYIPKIDIDDPNGYSFYSGSNPSIAVVESIERRIDRKVEDLRLAKSGLDKEVIESFKVSTDISTYNLSKSGDEKKSSSGAATAVGYIASFMIYMFIFIYGAMCMRGVIEEKNTRIVEVIVSSVKPFQLMVGKVIGIAAVGLTQFLIWILLTMVVVTGVSAVVGADKIAEGQQANQVMQGQQQMDPSQFEQAFSVLDAIDFPLVIGAFLFFFMGGYLLYGALFAAVGSASDTDQDSQQFMFPVTIPLIAAIVMLGAVLKDPNGSLAFWMSMIPFTSPIVMMMRVPFGVPIWELILSMVLLVLGFIFTTWVASRIYRVGILMHGTKVNWKILAKWFMSSN